MLSMKITSALCVQALFGGIGFIFCAPAWAADLQTWPAGKPVGLATVAQPIQVVNVWATWCAPCRKEMPMLSRWYRQHGYGGKSTALQLIGIALDTDANLQRFTREVNVRYPLWRYVGQDSRQFMQGLGNAVGALPFTLVRAPKCGFQQAVLGEISAAKLDLLVKQAKQQCASRHIAVH